MATIFEDNFNSYNDGDLNGQGNWATDYGTAGTIDVQGTTVYEGAKAIKTAAVVDEEVAKTGSQIAEGKTTFYIRKEASSARDGYLMFFQGATIKGAVGFRGDVLQFRGDAAFETLIASPNFGQWYCIECEYSLTHGGKIRYRVDGGSWTYWTSGYSAFTSYLNVIKIYFYAGTGGADYLLDYIAENPYAPPAAGRSHGYIFSKIYENIRNLAQRIFRIPPLVDPGHLPAI